MSRERETEDNGGDPGCQDCLWLERACAEHDAPEAASGSLSGEERAELGRLLSEVDHPAARAQIAERPERFALDYLRKLERLGEAARADVLEFVAELPRWRSARAGN